jgi:hypothetical protein
MRMRQVIVALTLLLGLPGPAVATSIPFAVSATDFGAPSTFVFTFIVPTFITGPTVATVSLSGTLPMEASME